NNLSICYRCDTAIEPLTSEQWFVDVNKKISRKNNKSLKELSIEIVQSGEINIMPEKFQKVYYHWMNNLHDWCISRQIWWGHQIPAWNCKECGKVTVAREDPDMCVHCQSKNIEQEEDVLDTWFSSALWPFSTSGWPDKTKELSLFYPTSVLVTAFDILFFWVARMMMMGLKFMGEVPFKEVYIHAIVRDVEGKKMSKSKGNVIDPLTVMDQYGTDAFRFTLAALAVQGRDVRLAEERIKGYRNFANKIWNASRFALMNLEGYNARKIDSSTVSSSLVDKWILSRLHRLIREVEETLRDYKFNELAHLIYHFIWHEFCDWYLEMAKQNLYGQDESLKQSSRSVLQKVLTGVLRITHPFMPFVTEEIWQRLPDTEGSIMVAEFPVASDFIFDEEALKEMELVKGVITGVRNIRGEMNIPPSKQVNILMEIPDRGDRDIIRRNIGHIQNLARVDSASAEAVVAKPEASATAVFGENQVHVILEGLLDFKEEKERLRKQIKAIEKEMAVANKKLNNKQFLEKAPTQIVEEVREKVGSLGNKLEKLNQNLNLFESINV
ncbi:MAG: class I tRNA ligase family protein, partial [Deltaproteobacteria bacterium]|nr:class I tRNA ligase family protein [Deltaproteobacteria bacterium]